MTIPELIAMVLLSIRNQFYDGSEPKWGARAFARDEKALTKAIARYGYACNERGWRFEAEAILKDLMGLLQEVKKRAADIGYLPVYLQGAVDRHVGQRAEELSARAKAQKATPKLVEQAVGGVQAVVVVEKSGTEVLAEVYRDLAKQKRVQRAQRQLKTKEKQEALRL